MKRFLVTGGAGFIGSNFIRYLLKNNSDVSVINLDKLTYAGNLENLRDLESDSKYQFVHGDICNARLVEQLLQKVDWVVHFASETHVDRSIDCADDFIQTNVVGTRVLLDAVRLTGRIHRFLHFSTDEVYGSTAQGEFSEDAPFQPTSPYSASKAAADLMVQAYQKTHKVPAIILRGCNNYGPYQYPEKVIPLFITNLLEEKKVPLYSHGENSREWIYVEDTCRAIMLVSEKGRVGEAYNVGSSFELANLALVKMIIKELGKTEDVISFVKDRLAHDLRYRLNLDKIRQLGFRVTDSFASRLHHTVQWYRENEVWWKPLKRDRYTLKV